MALNTSRCLIWEREWTMVTCTECGGRWEGWTSEGAQIRHTHQGIVGGLGNPTWLLMEDV